MALDILKNALIEDPAGSEPYGNSIKDADSHLETFFKTNPAGYDITFNSANDIVRGNDVFLDAEIVLVPDYGIQIMGRKSRVTSRTQQITCITIPRIF